MTFHEKIRKEIPIDWINTNTLDIGWQSDCLIFILEGTLDSPKKWFWVSLDQGDNTQMAIGYEDHFSEKFYCIEDFKKAIKKETILKNFK